MKKLTILAAFFIAASSLTMTSCVKDSESASVEGIRTAKAEQLKAAAAMQKAQAEAAIILANAEKTIKEAEAKLREADAAVKLAEAEHQKTQTEISKVALEKAKAELEVAKQKAMNDLSKLIHKGETDKIARQIELNKLKIEMDLALANQTNFKLQYFYNTYLGLIGEEAQILDYNTGNIVVYDGLRRLSDQILQNKQWLFDAEWNLTAEGYNVRTRIEALKNDIAAKESLIESYKSQKELGYDGYLAEAKKFDKLAKEGDVALSGLNNESTKALDALDAARQIQSYNNKPNGAMYDSEFAVAARLLNSTKFPKFTDAPENDYNWGTFTFVPTNTYVQPVKTYEVLGRVASYTETIELENYGAADKANLEVQVNNYAVAYETYYTNQINQRQRNLNYWNPILEKSTKEYNDSLALRPKRLEDKEKTFDAFLSPFNKSVALSKEYYNKTTYHKNIGAVSTLNATGDVAYVISTVGDAITFVEAAIVEVNASAASDNKTKELALLNGLKDQYGALLLPAKAYRTAYVDYNANVAMMDNLLSFYFKDGVDISIKNATQQVDFCKKDIAEYNEALSKKGENIAKIKAAQAVVTDAAKVAAYGELFKAAKTALNAYSDTRIAYLIQGSTNGYNNSMSTFYINLANAIQSGSAVGQNVIDQMISQSEMQIADYKNQIEKLEKFGAGNNTEWRISYFKEQISQLEAAYKRTEVMAANYKALLDAEIAKGN